MPSLGHEWSLGHCSTILRNPSRTRFAGIGVQVVGNLGLAVRIYRLNLEDNVVRGVARLFQVRVRAQRLFAPTLFAVECKGRFPHRIHWLFCSYTFTLFSWLAGRVDCALILRLLMLGAPRSVLWILRYAALSFSARCGDIWVSLGDSLSSSKFLIYTIDFWLFHVVSFSSYPFFLEILPRYDRCQFHA
jgi:hypothetical protein